LPYQIIEIKEVFMSESKEKSVTESNRIVYVQGEFNEEKAEKVSTSLLDFERKDPTKDILMFIDSYGGHVHSFMAIHDVMRHMLRCDVATLCIGKAMSCGQMLLISGTKGKRFITPSSRVMLHEISSGSWGKLSEIENDLGESKKLLRMWFDMITKYTHFTPKQLREMLNRGKDRYFSADECIKLGLADKIVRRPSDLYNAVRI
jgi:ATP-dependent Clp protease, protease subunit